MRCSSNYWRLSFRIINLVPCLRRKLNFSWLFDIWIYLLFSGGLFSFTCKWLCIVYSMGLYTISWVRSCSIYCYRLCIMYFFCRLIISFINDGCKIFIITILKLKEILHILPKSSVLIHLTFCCCKRFIISFMLYPLRCLVYRMWHRGFICRRKVRFSHRHNFWFMLLVVFNSLLRWKLLFSIPWLFVRQLRRRLLFRLQNSGW